MALSAGTRLGPYEVLAAIGAGGMGEVYRALDPRIGREVAIKVLPASFSTDPERLRRFEQEARATGALNHPNILSIYDVGKDDGSPYLVCELLEGQTLREKLRAAPVPQRKAIEYALQISQGLAAAHNKGIIHRDLKPENLFVTTDGRVKILDFGLAKLIQFEAPQNGQSKLETAVAHSQPGTVLGTVGYMSPEQVRGLASDHRSDIFSLGAILYEMLSGNALFRRETDADTMSAILHAEPPELLRANASISPTLDSLIRHCLEKSPEERFQSARDLAFHLQVISGQSASTDTQLKPVAQHRKTLPRSLLVALGLIAAMALGILAGLKLGRHSQGQPDSFSQPTFQRLTFQRGYIASARFAPDGHSVFYGAAFNENPTQIFSTRVESPESRNSGLPSARILSISRSGKMAILLNPRFTAGWMTSGTLAEVPMDGGSPRELLQDVGEAEWTPDGKDLLVVRSAPYYRIEFPAGKTLYRADGWISDARFSPSGAEIAFVDHPAFGDNRGSIQIVDLKGNVRKLTNEFPTAEGLYWSPSGTEVWITSGAAMHRSLIAVDLSGKQRTLYESIAEIMLQDVSSNGDALISRWNRRREMRALLAGHAAESNLSWFDYSIPRDLSNDGKTVLFEEPGDVSGFQYPTYIRHTDGSPPIRLGEGDAISLSPDGKWALVGLWGDPFNLALLPTGLGEKKILAMTGVQPTSDAYNWWFHDGKRILIRGNQPGHPVRYWIYELESGKLQPATPEGVSTYAMPTPDENSILACCKDHAVWLYSSTSGNPKQVPGLTENDVPAQWTLDGRSVYVTQGTGNPLNVYLIDLETGQRTIWKQIEPPDPAGILGVDSFHVTPDGKAYVYSYRRVLSDLFLVKGLK